MAGVLFLLGIFLLIGGALIFLGTLFWRYNLHIWWGSYLRQSLKPGPRLNPNTPRHILFCFVDHFEPFWKNATYRQALGRLNTWVQNYPVLAAKHRDANGIPPQHTFFYPCEEYQHELLNRLAFLCHQGFGEVEIHLHHDNDTAQRLRESLEDFKTKLVSHGLLSKNKSNGRTQYGFIHGNCALDNSRRDGKWCGVNNELLVLKNTGCYADFTLPSAPSQTQTRKINSIYYATDDPLKPKSHNTGVDVEAKKISGGDLMIVQGPLVLNWKKRKWGLIPRIEVGELSGDNMPSQGRVALWLKPHIHVRGNPDWLFIKIFTHGAQENNIEMAFNGSLDHLFTYLENHYNNGSQYVLHYVTARQMYNIIRAAEDGHGGDPHQYRDYLLRSLDVPEERPGDISGLGKGCENQKRTGG